MCYLEFHHAFLRFSSVLFLNYSFALAPIHSALKSYFLFILYLNSIFHFFAPCLTTTFTLISSLWVKLALTNLAQFVIFEFCVKLIISIDWLHFILIRFYNTGCFRADDKLENPELISNRHEHNSTGHAIRSSYKIFRFPFCRWIYF